MAIATATLRGLYEQMLVIREFETEAERQYKAAHIGGYSYLDLSASMPIASSAVPLENLDGMEKTAILRVLAQTNGHQQKAAELLGISRRTLSRKLKLYGREAVRQSYAS